MTNRLALLRDGRHIGVTGLGDPSGARLVLMCHPSPGAGGFDPDPPATATAGIRVITLDRPGYGASDAPPETDEPLDAWLDDLDEYLQSIENTARSIADTEFGPIGVVGWGVGAVYATGLAARHPELIDRLALIEPTGATRARRRAAASEEPIDARLEDPSALDDYLGASDRMERMLDAVGEAADGMQLDARVLAQPHWTDALSGVEARTVIMSSVDSDGSWYGRRMRGARAFGEWADPATTIVAAWKTVLRFLTAER